MAFEPFQAYPNVVIMWIRFPELLGYLYKHKILAEIGEMVGNVVKLYMNTDSRAIGVPNFNQRAFTKGRVWISSDHLLSLREEKPSENHSMVEGRQVKEEENYGLWMIVERRPRQKFRYNVQHSYGNSEREKEAYRSNKGKDIIINNQQSKESLYSANSRQVMDSKNKGKSKVLGSKNGLGSVTKELDNAGPNVVSSLANKSLGIDMMAQKLMVGTTSSTGKPTVVGDLSGQEIWDSIPVNNRPSVNLAVLGSTMEGLSTDEVVVEVGSLDSDKYSTMVFSKNKKNSNTPPSSKVDMVLNQVTLSDRESVVKARGRGFTKKLNKMYSSSSSRFKINGSQRVLLKDSMVQLAKSISNLIKEKPSSNGSPGGGEQQRGGELLG
ncbi:hypothetical protein GOBAR_AA18866 [Gossypium barbadense]|uniref:DUF4283 domain-containing protein n=1 Tax=Gossypium barbadense TaxID=3634 RepID=A0A2P5XEL7_GOSBA|nr:hypothetical protein GOBAR_AA18866 [Gossypium barbadense]